MLTTWLVSHIVLLLGFFLGVPVIAQMLRQRRSPASSLAWLMIIVLVPYLGIPLYLMLGGRKMRQLAEDKADLRLDDHSLSLHEATRDIDLLLRSHGIPGASDGNWIQLCMTGEESYASLVERIGQARHSIWVCTFILHPDTVGLSVINLLAERAAAGVEIRVLLDGVGSLKTSRRSLLPLTRVGGEVAFFMPVLHRPLRGRSNLRNHRKAVIFDESSVWAGGANIAREYIGPEPEEDRWRDLSFVLEGPATRHYLDIFRSDWQFATGQKLRCEHNANEAIVPRSGNTTLQVVPTGPDVKGDPLYATLVSAIFAARERIRIVTPYFLPDETLVQALQMALHRGVCVRILIPDHSNHWFADLARGTYLRDLQKTGADILLFQNGMMHGKALVIDDSLAVIGSANFDMRSLFLNYETGLLVYSQTDIRRVCAWIEDLGEHCRQGVSDVNALRDLSEGVARMMTPVL